MTFCFIQANMALTTYTPDYNQKGCTSDEQTDESSGTCYFPNNAVSPIRRM
jgi:hypothetical protein